MGPLVEVQAIIREYGIWFAVGSFFLWFFGAGTFSRLFKFIRKHLSATEKIELQHFSIVDPTDPEPNIKKKRIIMRHEILSGVKEVKNGVDDLNIILSEHCGSSSCPMVPLLKGQITEINSNLEKHLEEMKEFYTNWAKESTKTREETLHLVEGLYDRQNAFLDGSMSRLVLALETMAELSSRRSRNPRDNK